MQVFVSISDPRSPRHTQHDLAELLTVVVCGVLSGADDFVGIEEWAKLKLDWLRGFMKLEQGIPSHDTLARVLGTIVRYGGADGLSAIREFSKDAPEAYMIGKLMHEGGSPSLIDHATKEMKRRATEKDKYINKVDRKLSDPDVSDIMPPQMLDSFNTTAADTNNPIKPPAPR